MFVDDLKLTPNKLWMFNLTLIMVFISKMVAVALLLGWDQDVRRGGRDPVPEEQLRPQ